jgi:folate-binding protein YgfZ
VGDVVRVDGPGAATYLQGQLSQDVDTVIDGWSFLLEPTGHIVALLRVTRVGDDAFTLEADAGLGERVEARLRKFLLRTKATISLEPGTTDDAARIRDGRPGAPEFDERAVPAETGWVSQAVSFTKGCYTGQELVARMDSRVAEPPRRLVRLSADAELTAGTPIEVDGAAVGSVTSAAGPVGLGYVKRGARTSGDAVAGATPVQMEPVDA